MHCKSKAKSCQPRRKTLQVERTTRKPSWNQWQIYPKDYQWPTRHQARTVNGGRIWCSIEKKFKQKTANLDEIPTQVWKTRKFDNVRGAFNKSPDFFLRAFRIVIDSWKFTVIAIHLMRWLTNFYDFMFKWTATAGIGIHPTKVWLSQLVNFKNAIWTWGHFRRTICNKILF